MSANSKTDNQVISLPKGGGALHGIGEKFSPDLHTGTGNFTVPIALPPGRNGFQPQLNLVYSTGNGNGPFGLGWSLSVPGVTRQTSKGVPRYRDYDRDLAKRDTFILSGAEDLVPVEALVDEPSRKIVRYRPRTEGLFAEILHHYEPSASRNYWEVRSKDGLVSYYGTNPAVGEHPSPDPGASLDPPVIFKPSDQSSTDFKHIFAWKLTLTKDPFGNRIEYLYERDKSTSNGEVNGRQWDQPLLKQIRYVDYGDASSPKFLVTATFLYDDGRHDPFSEYRAGFEIRTTKRCSAILVETHADADRKVRKYEFKYAEDGHNAVSRLTRVDIVGFDDAGNEARELPPLEFGYSDFKPEEQKRRDFYPIRGSDLPAFSLANPDFELVDLFGNGLPDILQMNGAVRYWRNRGDGRYDLPRPMNEAPPVALAAPGVQLVDANGDGRTDLLVTQNGLSGYYSLRFGGLWDRKSFQKYERAPSFNLEDPEVRLVDLTGDGVTDVIRSGTRLECFFNDPRKGWLDENTRWVERRGLEEFPNVNFSDPRVKWADISGDGLQDIVLVHDGNVEYWPNLGYGNWGKRIHMTNSPRFSDSAYHLGYDPRRILIGDVDGDGLADIIYVDNRKVTLWINQSGNSWSDPIEIDGTPPVSDMDAVRLVDLLGTGVSGVLWSSDFSALSRGHVFFLDLTGGVKPYLLDQMDNHMGAVTKVEYSPSTKFYLEDQKQPKTRWKTPLPFPVQVVSRVEVIDEISKGKLTTEYKYHHGYWDGAEREFRGFGMVEQLDTETFERYSSPGLHGDGVEFNGVEAARFSPPTLTKTWFHQGPVGEEFGDWEEGDYSAEYWDGDPKLLNHTEQVNAFLRNYNDRDDGAAASPGNRRIKRDALRTLRGSVLRTELYALDDSERQDRPYTVTEHAYSLREESKPAVNEPDRLRIFFPHLIAQRTTQWERGDDPMTQISLTDDYDDFGQPHAQTAVAMPRRANKRLTVTGAVVGDIQPDKTKVLATHTFTSYATPPAGKYMHNRVAQAKAYELLNPAGAPDLSGDDVRTVLQKQLGQAQQVRDILKARAPDAVRVFSHVVNHYNGKASEAFKGLPVGQLGDYGALVRTETLVLTEDILRDAYTNPSGDRRPSYLEGTAAAPEAPPGFGSRTGYHKVNSSAEGYLAGWYADTQCQQLDFQAGAANPRGLVVAMRDSLGNETRIEEYEHQLLPKRVKDAAGLETTADYNYRVLQPARMTDPNGTSTHMRYNSIGLPLVQFVRGTDAAGNETLGGADDKPEIAFLYDFLHFERASLPIYVHTTRRIHHASDNLSDDTIESREYSDGFGRLNQTRSQAEEEIFGATGDDVGLPAQPGADPGPAVAQRAAERVVVSGWQVFDNKGRVIEKYEPFFSQKFDFEPEADAKRGKHATMFYDPRGNVVRTLNPDGSQQRVILGMPRSPNNLALSAAELESQDVPDSFEPTPWETYTYDANDLAGLTHPGATEVPNSHRFTPASGVIDALGRVLCQVQRNGSDPANAWFITRTEYDLRGNALKIIDALKRDAFKHSYDLLNRPLRVDSIDAGLRTSVLDAQGNLIEYRDSKGSLVRRTYDALNRPRELWARNDSAGRFTLRERVEYGDDGTHALARVHNTLGRPIKHYDEAGLLEMPEYDFKGNLLEKSRRTVRDDALANEWLADWDAANAADALETAAYQTSSRYDALNRPTEITYPQDVDGERKKLIPRYNRAGALEAVALDEADYVQHIAYNAKGQRVLIAYGNGVMTRHAYDPETFRLARLRTDRVSQPGLLSRFLDFFSGGNADTMTFQSNGSPIQDFAYTYDLAGNITTIEEHTPRCGITDSTEGQDRLLRKFEYDPIYRLTLATGRSCKDIGVPRGLDDDPRCGFYAGGAATATQDNAPDLTERYTERFSYDPAGNMLELHYQAGLKQWARRFGMSGFSPKQWMEKLSVPPGGAPIDWGNEGNRLTNVGDENQARNHQFDANGNLIQQNTERHHTWDHADRMIGYRVQPNSSPALLVARYLYGADGMRVKKWVRKNGGGSNDKSTVCIDAAFEHHKWTESGTPRENNHLHVMDNQSRIAIVRIGDKHPDDGGEKVQYHLGDHLGSSSVVVGGDDSTGNDFINREEYFPYGETSFGSFAKKRYRYSGKERDEESGLYYYGARYAAAPVCRWISVDPLAVVPPASGSPSRPLQSAFTYNLLVNNPMRMVELSGMAPLTADEAQEILATVADEYGKAFEAAKDSKVAAEFRKELAAMSGIPDAQEKIGRAYGFWLGKEAENNARTALQKLYGKSLKLFSSPAEIKGWNTQIDIRIPEKKLNIELKTTMNAFNEFQQARQIGKSAEEGFGYALVYARVKQSKGVFSSESYYLNSKTVRETAEAAGWTRKAAGLAAKATGIMMLVTTVPLAANVLSGEKTIEQAADEAARNTPQGVVWGFLEKVTPGVVTDLVNNVAQIPSVQPISDRETQMIPR